MWRLPLVAIAALVALPACRPDTVRVTFRPEQGAEYRYEIRVTSLTTVALADAAPTRSEEETLLQAEHRVLDVAPGGGPIRVEVRLRRRGSAPQTFVVRLDRAGQLEQVERIEGLPAAALGDLGVSELFPAAAGAPPDRPLEPGEDWVIETPVELPASEPSRLTGEGRLLELGVAGGRDLATVRSRTRLPVARTTPRGDGELTLEGVEVTESTARHDLADGAVERATSLTRGSFAVTLSPPDGGSAPPVDGRLTVEVRSEVRRMR